MDGSSTASAVASRRTRSGVTRRTVRRPDCDVSAIRTSGAKAPFLLASLRHGFEAVPLMLCRLLHLLCGCDRVFDAALEVGGLLGAVIVLAFDDLLEAA